MMRTRLLIALLVPVLCLGLAAATCRAADDVIDNSMDHDPELVFARAVNVYSDKLLPLWLSALDRPDADTKCRAALTIAQAHERGMPGLAAAVGPLTRELDRPGQHPATVAAVARALVVLDAKESAGRLLGLAAAGDPDVREIVEPALAKWDHKPARAAWLDRLNRPERGRGLTLAIQSLAAVREASAAARLRELAVSADEPPPVRLEAARALAVLRTAGSEADAEKLAADATPAGRADRLLAATLLRHHSGDAAVRRLQSLAGDPEPAVAAVALARLLEIDPSLVEPVLVKSAGRPDANVRALAVEALVARPTETHLHMLANRLDDAHPAVRVRARKALVELAAGEGRRGVVIHETTRILTGTDWRGQEQAAVVLAQLGHQPAAARLLALLPSPRAEVRVTAAWAMRKLAVPDTLPAVLAYVQAQTRRAQGGASPADDRQLSQLIQFLGDARHRQADPLLRKFIPRGTPVGTETRAAAAYALGLFHENKPVPELTAVIAGRLAAVTQFDQEEPRFRRMCAAALGRMKAAGALPVLRQFYAGAPNLEQVNNTCGWAIERITGEKVPPPGVIEYPQVDWFLVPNN